MLVHSSHTQARGQELARVWAVYVRESQHDQIQAVHFSQVFFGLKSPFRQLAPRLRLVRLLAGMGVGFIHHPGRQFDIDAYSALRSFTPKGHGQAVRAHFVHLVFLREARLAAAVKDVVKLLSIGAIEYPGEVLWLFAIIDMLVNGRYRVQKCMLSLRQGTPSRGRRGGRRAPN